jgi:hypothetical protein
MPYIGSDPSNRFVAPKAATQFSGDGSTTAFTLDHAVGSDEDILVSVDGVIQEPSVAYAVSNGTTLTFTAAPSSNSGNNIFVYYLFRTVGTVSHPSNNALTATNGNFTGTLTVVDDVSIEGSTPTLSLADTDVSNNKVELNYDEFLTIDIDPNNARGNTGLIVKGDGTERMRLDSIGALTIPNQPAFLAQPAATIQNLSTGANNGLVFGTERFDQNADYNASNGVFTAPVTGKYMFNVTFYLNNIDQAANYYEPRLDTSNRSYYINFDPDFGQDNSYFTLTFAHLVDMDANDTADINIHQDGGSSQTDISAASMFSMYLVC